MRQKNWQLYFAVLVLAFIILGSVLAPLLATHNPFEPDMASRLQGPSWQHFFGTDALGRDMYSRILYGGRASMLLTLVSSVLALAVGVAAGTACGFYGGRLDLCITTLSNIFQGIPGSCFMIALAGVLGPGTGGDKLGWLFAYCACRSAAAGGRAICRRLALSGLQ